MKRFATTDDGTLRERVVLCVFLVVPIAISIVWMVVAQRASDASMVAVRDYYSSMARVDAAVVAINSVLDRQAGASPVESLIPPPPPPPPPETEVAETEEPVEEPVATPPPPPTLLLRGVIRRGNSLLAVINNQVLARGEAIAGYQVQNIRPTTVTLMNEAGERKHLLLFED